MENYPQKLPGNIKEILFFLLPEDKTGYAEYRNKIDGSNITGEGRLGEGNYYLGSGNIKPDLNFPSTDVFAVGELFFKAGKVDAVIHEEDEDGFIEFQVNPFDEDFLSGGISSGWTLSTWVPRSNFPEDNSEVREVDIYGKELVLCFAKKQKLIWFFNAADGVNKIIPLTNYYNELMGIINERDPKEVFNPSKFYDKLSDLSDEVLLKAFLTYNKYLKKTDIDIKNLYREEPTGGKSIFEILKKRNV